MIGEERFIYSDLFKLSILNVIILSRLDFSNLFIYSFDAVKTTRRVEEFVRKVGGFQMMYADSYMTKTEFRQMFDHTLYDKMRLKFNCEGCFPEVYDKVNKSSRSGTS